MKTETITDHDLAKIAENWYKGIEHVDTGLKTAFAAGYRFAERQANGHDTGERQLTIPDVSKSWHFCPNCGITWEKDSVPFGCWSCGYDSHVC